jgi:hypothetical protein
MKSPLRERLIVATVVSVLFASGCSQQAEKGILGKWRTAGGDTAEFKSDGTADFLNGPFVSGEPDPAHEIHKYELKGTALTLETPAGKVTELISLDKDELGFRGKQYRRVSK